MDLQQIKYFLAVVDFGTFLAASEHVHVSQPTLSAGIRNLEQSLNTTLFDRGSRAATLTTSGELFLDDARQSYNQLMSAKSKLAGTQQTLKIGILNTIPMDHIAESIQRYKNTHSYVFIEVVVTNHSELTKLLQSSKLDLIVTSVSGRGKHFKLLFKEQLKLAVPTSHPLATKKEIGLKQLNDQMFIERIRCESWDDVHRLFKKHKVKPVSVCRAESDESVLALVAANLGVSIMPVRKTPYAVSFIPIKDLKINRPIGICTNKVSLAPHIESFYDTIRSAFK